MLRLLTCCMFIIESILARKPKYHTYKEPITRATPYRPEVLDKTCLLKPDVGPCRGEIPVYYYDPTIGDCSTFYWGGCQGNGNRFDSRYECLQSCLSSPNARRQRPKWCSLTFDFGFCFGSLKRWYYDPLWKVCKERIYSGCGGNKNNFYNKEQCESICNYNAGSMKWSTRKSGRVKKILIVNPIGATSKRGKVQKTTIKGVGSKNATNKT